MRLIIIAVISIFNFYISLSQQSITALPSFTSLDMLDAQLCRAFNHYYMSLLRIGSASNPTERRYFLYKINNNGDLIDSVRIGDQYNIRNYSGMPFVSKNEYERLYFLGTCSFRDTFLSQRYAGIELDSNLNLIIEFEFPIFKNFRRTMGLYRSSNDGTSGIRSDFCIYQNTFYASHSCLLIDSPFVVLGAEHHYFKGTLDGEVLADHTLPAESHISFFRGNQLYVLGYNGVPNTNQQYDVAWYDHNGQFVKGLLFNPTAPTLCNGGAIDNRLYFSYVAPSWLVPGGCPSPTVAIDVRDLNFNLIRRFRVNECGYNYCGNMPFAKGMDGSIYFQAVHESYEKFLVQKYTPDLQLIWSKEFKGHSDTLFVAPMQIVPTEDGGVLIKCFHLFGDSKVSLYKISADGDAVRVIEFNTGTPEPSVLAPNPCRDVVRYTGTYDRPLIALVHSADGRTVRTLTLHNATLDVATLPPGLYSVLLLDAERPEQVLHRQKLLKVGN